MPLDGSVRTFEPPGPGVWECESAHFPRPLTRLQVEILERALPEGFAMGMKSFGLLLETFVAKAVHGFIYIQVVPFGAPPGAKGPPPKLIIQLVTRLVPKMRARLRVAHEAFETKLWREELRRWDEQVKPASIAAHKEIQAIDVGALDDDALARHLTLCRDHLLRMVRQRYEFTVAGSMAAGDLLAHVGAWTGKSTGEILAVLKGSTPVSKGIAAAELEALGAAIREDADAKRLIQGHVADAGAVLAKLRAHPGAVGAATNAYLDVVGLRSLGYDVTDHYALELPDVLVRAIRVTALRTGRGDDGGVKERIAALRAEVPEEHRAQFDELLAEARLVNRLRDERGVYSDAGANGLMRRVMLEVGRRLADKGLLEDATLALDATLDELHALLRAERAVGSSELRERAAWRANARPEDAPATLGGASSGPPPAEWLPAHARRSQRAVAAFLDAMWHEPPPRVTAKSVTGLAVSGGHYEGRARTVLGEADFGKLEQGDVLVARTTSPTFNVVLPLLGAIVTDRGGQLCHAAIVAREYGIPGVVGTKEATKVIADGARVRVDGDTGEVTVLS